MLYPLSFNDLYNRFFLLCLGLDLSFLPGVARPCEEPSQDDTDKKGAQEHKRIGDGPLPREKMNINNLGILVSKDDDQDS